MSRVCFNFSIGFYTFRFSSPFQFDPFRPQCRCDRPAWVSSKWWRCGRGCWCSITNFQNILSFTRFIFVHFQSPLVRSILRFMCVCDGVCAFFNVFQFIENVDQVFDVVDVCLLSFCSSLWQRQRRRRWCRWLLPMLIVIINHDVDICFQWFLSFAHSLQSHSIVSTVYATL